MAILFVGTEDSQSEFRQAMDLQGQPSLAPPTVETLQSMPQLSHQYQWVVLDMKSCGVGRDAAPLLPACAMTGLASEQRQRRGCSAAGLQFEYDRAEIVSYHRPRQR